MEMYWDSTGTLRFRVHLKDNQQLKYLTAGSSHPAHVFKAVRTGVLGRLARLTSATPTALTTPLDELYPEHAAALSAAGIVNDQFPTLRSELARLDRTHHADEAAARARRQRQRRRCVYFCIGYSHFWEKPIWRILKTVQR